MLSVLTLDLDRDLGDPRPVTIAGEGQTVYGNGRSLYVTGTVRHPRDGGGRVPAPILRSLVVGDTLWTFSDQGARATDTATLAERAWLRL